MYYKGENMASQFEKFDAMKAKVNRKSSNGEGEGGTMRQLRGVFALANNIRKEVLTTGILVHLNVPGLLKPQLNVPGSKPQMFWYL